MDWLYIKRLLIRTPLEKPADRLRNLAGAVGRLRHPELHDIYMEPAWIDRLLEGVIQPDWNCIDIGCHIGSHLSFILRHAPRGAHLAIEPVPEKALWVRRKFPEAEVKTLALSDRRERRRFYRNLTHSSLSGFGGDSASRDKIVEFMVDCERLDDVVEADRSYSYIKIDVEGAELLALRGARQTIARDRPVILFESSHDGAAKLGLKREDLFALLTDELGYDIFLVKDFLASRPPLDLAGFQKAAEYPFLAFNFWAVPRERRAAAPLRAS